METEYIYWRHDTPTGIRVEEISGAEQRSGKLWLEMARQIFSENGGDCYRIINHYESGAPYLEGEQKRISVSNTKGLLVVASLPKTPEAEMSIFSPRTALGVDAERTDREQVLSIRDKFLSEEEKQFIPANDLQANLLAWTAKEALFKAALASGVDWRKQLRIASLPELLHWEGSEKKPLAVFKEGKAQIIFADGNAQDMTLFAYESEGCYITLAYSPKCAKYQPRK